MLFHYQKSGFPLLAPVPGLLEAEEGGRPFLSKHQGEVNCDLKENFQPFPKTQQETKKYFPPSLVLVTRNRMREGARGLP